MREIKFRVWEKDKKRFLYHRLGEGLCYTAEGKAFAFPRYHELEKRMAVMQFTGLKDKNGKEIYEGDIVLAPCAPSCKGKRSIKPHKCEVRWSSFGLPRWELAIIDYEPGFKWSTGYLNIGCNGDAFEVIGNIYENPELLKEGEKA